MDKAMAIGEIADLPKIYWSVLIVDLKHKNLHPPTLTYSLHMSNNALAFSPTYCNIILVNLFHIHN